MRYRLARGACAPIAVLLLLTVAVSPASAERPRVYAVTGGTVVPEPGVTIETGTVVIRDGLIEAVGGEVSIPPDAVEIDAAGHSDQDVDVGVTAVIKASKRTCSVGDDIELSVRVENRSTTPVCILRCRGRAPQNR